MKLRADIVRMYKDIHGWVGILSGLALFIAFYAGAITMFEEPLQRWASPPSPLAAPVSLDRTSELVTKVLAAHPEAARDYTVHLRTGPEQPARVSWSSRPAREHAAGTTYYAALAPDGSLQVDRRGPSAVAQLIDVLHQQVGLPFDHEIAMPIMGTIALLYAIALVSGVVVLLPSLVSDLFALRIGRNVKRMWLDVHNVLGVFSLPFHLIMALTAVVFAFHDQFYDAQSATFAHGGRPPASAKAPPPNGPVLAPVQVVQRLAEQAPAFTPVGISYGEGRDGAPTLRVRGYDPRYGLRGPNFGMATLDPRSGAITVSDYMPGKQDGWGAAITSFFALHFGNFGGAGVRWAYLLLGLAGAFLFYTGNLLWVESRRKRERKAGAVEQTRGTRILCALTVGVPLGCVAGIAVTIAAAKPMGLDASEELHSAIYYAVFLAFTAWALVRGGARGALELLPATAGTLMLIPVATLACLGAHPPRELLVDLLALVGAGSAMLMWRMTRRRLRTGPTDSVWSRPSDPDGRVTIVETASA
ncbi:PepSY domain-containing protein [Sphingomonas sp. PL-96]|uniref:PepSY-associated TM helix domain-containing protein n=1 Tax=Sphingomonas sp. PL-96 TaxID=2887201 RepID=UPI001E59529D|nr:PepSY-associated TM helix domain-containing protein [Sphingomonas sp. PL-96]MCC2977949.1 PepSY domain-containing protein [Sphingomonas sp. PL-96]